MQAYVHTYINTDHTDYTSTYSHTWLQVSGFTLMACYTIFYEIYIRIYVAIYKQTHIQVTSGFCVCHLHHIHAHTYTAQ